MEQGKTATKERFNRRPRERVDVDQTPLESSVDEIGPIEFYQVRDP